MHDNEERHAVTAVLVGLFVLTIICLAIPEVGYVLLGLVGLGVASLIAIGIALLRTTGDRSSTDMAPRPRRASRDVVSR
jgi:hypothetical protein